jgi:hypothetical protein
VASHDGAAADVPADGRHHRAAHTVYVSRRCRQNTGAAPDINETERLSWIPLGEAQQRIAAGEIVGPGSVSGLLAVLLAKARGQF